MNRKGGHYKRKHRVVVEVTLAKAGPEREAVHIVNAAIGRGMEDPDEGTIRWHADVTKFSRPAGLSHVLRGVVARDRRNPRRVEKPLPDPAIERLRRLWYPGVEESRRTPEEFDNMLNRLNHQELIDFLDVAGMFK